MRVLCEVVVSDILPTLRALIANQLLYNYKINQSEISRKLGITKSAVSQYKKGLRGNKGKVLEENKKIMKLIKKLSQEIAKKKIDNLNVHSKLCVIGEEIIKEKILFDEEVFPGPCIVGRKT